MSRIVVARRRRLPDLRPLVRRQRGRRHRRPPGHHQPGAVHRRARCRRTVADAVLPVAAARPRLRRGRLPRGRAGVRHARRRRRADRRRAMRTACGCSPTSCPTTAAASTSGSVTRSAAAPGSPARRRFFFRDGRGAHGELPPNNWQAVFGGSVWTRVPDGQWYLATFTPWQPDLDWADQAVIDDFDDILRFWLDRGIDGFRVDAVTHVGKAPGLPDAPPLPPGVAETAAAAHNPYAIYWPSAHDVWRHWRTTIDAYERDHPGRAGGHGRRGVHRPPTRPADGLRAPRRVPRGVLLRPDARPVGGRLACAGRSTTPSPRCTPTARR